MDKTNLAKTTRTSRPKRATELQFTEEEGGEAWQRWWDAWREVKRLTEAEVGAHSVETRAAVERAKVVEAAAALKHDALNDLLTNSQFSTLQRGSFIDCSDLCRPLLGAGRLSSKRDNGIGPFISTDDYSHEGCIEKCEEAYDVTPSADVGDVIKQVWEAARESGIEVPEDEEERKSFFRALLKEIKDVEKEGEAHEVLRVLDDAKVRLSRGYITAKDFKQIYKDTVGSPTPTATPTPTTCGGGTKRRKRKRKRSKKKKTTKKRRTR